MRIYPFIENFCHKAISEGNYESRLQKLRNILDHADYVVIGAGAGLSDAAGIAYSGKRFTDNFTDFSTRYGLTDMYSSAFYPFKTEEERWAYWARHILMNRYGFISPIAQCRKGKRLFCDNHQCGRAV